MANGKRRVRLLLEPPDHALLADLMRRWECGPSEAVTYLLRAEAADQAEQEAKKAARERAHVTARSRPG